MMERESSVEIPRAAQAFVFLCAFWAYAFFLTPLPGDNINSRIDLAAAITAAHTVRIDAYANNTLDKAFLKGHYYCDKAPGLS
jgi:hypothetical protein